MASPPLHRPIPRRPFELPTDDDNPPTSPLTPQPEISSSDTIGAPPKRTKSTLALTASTLFGIYSPTYTDDAGTPSSTTPYQLSRNPSFASITPFTSSTPSSTQRTSVRITADQRSREREQKQRLHHKAKPTLPQLLGRVASLFVFGVAYGVIVTHLHGRTTIGGKGGEVGGWVGLVCWGFAGVVGGSVLPWLDGGVEGVEGVERGGWNQAVRSVGAFGGIAYAIRKLPWQSPLQLSLTLSLVNPFLWFTLDRTLSGFWFATFIAISGTVLLLHSPLYFISASIIPPSIISPSMTPSSIMSSQSDQQEELIYGIVGSDTLTVVTWIASVLFCSAVCFGNVGRRLARSEKRV